MPLGPVPMRAGLLTSLALVLLVPRIALAIPSFSLTDGFLSLALSSASSCSGPGECVIVDVAVNAANPTDVLLFDLQIAWDPTYWTLDSIVDPGTDIQVVKRDDAAGFIDDLSGDVALGPPVLSGDPLFSLVFEVVGGASPARTVLEIGDLSAFDAYFDRPVLVADAFFSIHTPTPNATIATPEPSAGLLLAAGLVAIARGRRSGGTRR